jgi:hydroxymethylpyrimidine/phosphomethylpyrimidine kinase
VKTGMLASEPIIAAVTDSVQRHRLRPLVVDPVMVAKGGDVLLRPEALDALRRHLLPLATVVTPNLPEAAMLAGRTVATLEDMREAARAILDLGPAAVVVKGGHLPEDTEAVDLLYDGQTFTEIRSPRFDTPHTHGTGCTFASAIAAGLARGYDLTEAVNEAKALITAAVRHGLALGRGHGPANGMALLYERAGLLG